MTDKKFVFNISNKPVNTFKNKDFKTFLEKWYLLDRIKAWTFSFDQQLLHYDKQTFAEDFFKDPTVLSKIQVMSNAGTWGNFVSKVHSIKANEIPCNLTSMKIFDKLCEENIVRSSGTISRCFDEFYEGITISDELRKMLVLEDSDNFEMYNDEERNEFLFRLFTHICIGGPICQYEDTIQPYLDVTKSLYKELISVQKSSGDGELSVVSKVYKISAKDENGNEFYPGNNDHIQNFAYLIVEPVKRTVSLLYHSWGKGFW